MNPSLKTCLVVGGHGYLGSELIRYLNQQGWRAISTTHRARENGDIPYSLGGEFPPDALKHIKAIVHCAYDFGPTKWNDIHEKNVLGTQRLLEQAKRAGVEKIITISSISAFPGCRSLYGKAKLLIEDATLAAGGVALRPGLIYGGTDRGMYGRLQAQANAGRPIPLLAGSPCTQFLIHVEDLCRVIEAILSDKIPPPTTPWVIANPEPWPLKELLKAIAGPKKLKFIKIPWQGIWLGLRCAELIGIKLAFKSDSVRSIVHQNLEPDLRPIQQTGLPLRGMTPNSTSSGEPKS